MKTHITFVLDSSGSMSAIEDDTKGGFNTFLEDQKHERGTATVTLYDFNTDVELVYREYPIEDAPKLDDHNYTPSGRTALHDAIYRAITETADGIAAAEDQPDNVIVVVLTDGKENASETPQERVREQVRDRREEYDWEFLFIGANQDAALTASSLGMDADRSLEMDHSGEGVRSAYSSTSERISQARRKGTTGEFENVYEALNHPRRRYICYALRADTDWSLRELATKVAAWEGDIPASAVTDQQREEMYQSLYQTHVPNLADKGVVTLDKTTEPVRPGKKSERAQDVLDNRGTNYDFNQEVHARSEIDAKSE